MMSHSISTFFSVLMLGLCQPAIGVTVGFFYALDEDLAALQRSGGTNVRNYSVGSTNVQQLVLNGHTVLAVRMGSGCVQTSLAAQALLAKQRCDLVISVGPVGDVTGDLEEDEWYWVEQVIAWQRGSYDATGFRLHAEARMKLTNDFPQGKTLDPLKDLPRIGVASGEVFVASDEFRKDLAERSGGSAVDMNLFGLVSVTKSHEVAGIHLRTPSDLADSKASEDFREFSENYQGAGGTIAAEVIRALPRDPTSPQAHDALREILKDPDAQESPQRIPQPEKGSGVPADPAADPPQPSD